jgi:hypothetical protein
VLNEPATRAPSSDASARIGRPAASNSVFFLEREVNLVLLQLRRRGVCLISVVDDDLKVTSLLQFKKNKSLLIILYYSSWF